MWGELVVMRLPSAIITAVMMHAPQNPSPAQPAAVIIVVTANVVRNKRIVFILHRQHINPPPSPTRGRCRWTPWSAATRASFRSRARSSSSSTPLLAHSRRRLLGGISGKIRERGLRLGRGRVTERLVLRDAERRARVGALRWRCRGHNVGAGWLTCACGTFRAERERARGGVRWRRQRRLN